MMRGMLLSLLGSVASLGQAVFGVVVVLCLTVLALVVLVLRGVPPGQRAEVLGGVAVVVYELGQAFRLGRRSGDRPRTAWPPSAGPSGEPARPRRRRR
jgi:hypothetical protein